MLGISPIFRIRQVVELSGTTNSIDDTIKTMKDELYQVISILSQGAQLIDNPLIIAELHKYCYLAEISVPKIDLIEDPSMVSIAQFYDNISTNLRSADSLLLESTKNYIDREKKRRYQQLRDDIGGEINHHELPSAINYYRTSVLRMGNVNSINPIFNHLYEQLGNSHQGNLPQNIKTYLGGNFDLVKASRILDPDNVAREMLTLADDLTTIYG